MAAANKLTLVFRAYGGQAAKIAILVGAAVLDPSGSIVAAIRAAIDALSTAKGTKATITVPGTVDSDFGDSNYDDVEDKLLATFRDAVGRFHTHRVPAPIDCFLPNSDVADDTNTELAAYITAVKDNTVTRGGVAITDFLHGRRVRFTTQKR